MKRAELLKLIDRAKRTEEDAVSSLAKHVDAATRWMRGSDDEVANIRRVLSVLMKDSAAHAKTLEEIRRDIEGGEKDVY